VVLGGGLSGVETTQGSGSTLVALQSVEDGRYGDTLEVIWEVEELFVLRAALVNLAEASGLRHGSAVARLTCRGCFPAQEEDVFIIEP